jgi:signal-transduction protein with cAMP-binding, CBS, and nucleotidyltransferase domain
LICPSCHFDNLPGEDHCVQCHQDLSHQDVPQAQEGLPGRILSDTLEKLCTHPPTTVAPTTTLREVLEIMRLKNVGSVVVGTEAPFQGIFTERDFLYKVAGMNIDMEKTPVSELMTANPATVSSHSPIAVALNHMSAIGVRHIPVERDGRLVEILSVQDILEYLQDLLEEHDTQPRDGKSA